MAEHIKILSVPTRVQYSGNGSTTIFDTGFAFFENDNVVVYLDNEVQTTGYSVSGVGETDGGSVTFTTAPSEGVVVTITRDIDIERVTDFQEGGTFRAKNLNDEFDRSAAIEQQLSEKLDRAMVMPPYVSGTFSLALPTPDAGKTILWNEDGTGLKNSETNIDELDTALTEAVATCTEKEALASAAATSAATSVNGFQTVVDTATTTFNTNATTKTNDFNTNATAKQALLSSYDTSAQASATSASTSATKAETAALQAVKRNIGELITSLLPITSADVHLTDGGIISQVGVYAQFATYLKGLVAGYPNLFCTETAWQAELTAYGQCAKFVIDNTANTIRLPKITEYIKGVSSLSELGSCLKAGLPNITFPNVMVGPSSGMPVAGTSSAYGTGTGNTVTLTSSVSNTIYGNSETVTPTSAKCAYYIVLATSSKTDIQVNIDNVVSDLNLLSNTKAGINMDNITATGKETVVGWGMPDYSAGVSQSAQVLHTAPVDGVILGFNYTNGENKLTINGFTFNYNSGNASNIYSGSGFCIPVSKGDTYKMEQAFSGSVAFLTFYPLKGVN